MPTYSLVPHPDYLPQDISKVSVDVFRLPNGYIDFEFDVHGPGAADVWRVPQNAAFTCGLWRSTCFEAFVAAAATPAYVELNAQPSGLWAAYHFTGYRDGMRSAPETDVEVTSFRWSHAVSVKSSATLRSLPAELPWRANFAAIIEATDGSKSYWALAHAPGPPDFHNPACFTATLPAPERP